MNTVLAEQGKPTIEGVNLNSIREQAVEEQDNLEIDQGVKL